MKPQRSQRKTLCPQKDPPIKEISERRAACGNSVRDKLLSIGTLKGKAQDDIRLGIYLSGFGKRRELFFFAGSIEERGKEVKD